MIDPYGENDVLLAFCHHGTVQTCFMNSFLAAFAEDAMREARGERRRLVEYHDAVGPYIQDNRARMVKYFLEHTGYQWLWMLDNDIEFSKDALYRLLHAAETHDAKILGAAYWNRYGKREVYLSWLLFTDEGIRALPDLPDTEDPVAVTAVGMGCTLIHRDVLQDVVAFQRSRNPDDPWDSFGADLLKFDDGTAQRMGEDVTFCLRARQVGHITYGLPSLVVEHHKSIFIPHGGVAALQDPRDAGGGEQSAHLGHEVQLVPSERTT